MQFYRTLILVYHIWDHLLRALCSLSFVTKTDTELAPAFRLNRRLGSVSWLTLNIPSLARQRCLPSWGPRRAPWFLCNFSTVWCDRLLKLFFFWGGGGFWNYDSVIQALLASNILCLFISTEVTGGTELLHTHSSSIWTMSSSDHCRRAIFQIYNVQNLKITRITTFRICNVVYQAGSRWDPKFFFKFFTFFWKNTL